MSKFLFNFILLTVMFFTLTTMPVNKKILDFNFSLEGFLAWEQSKNPAGETPETPADGWGDASMTIGTPYLYEPEQLVILIEGTGEVVRSASDIRAQMTLTVYDKDRSVAVLSGDQIPFLEDRLTDKTTVELVLDVKALKLPAGHYTLEFSSASAHVATGPTGVSDSVTAAVSTFEGKRYVPARQVAGAGNVALQIYYVDENLMHLIPLSQATANDRVLRKTANALAAPPPAGLGLLNEAPAFRVPNIQYAQGLASMYTRAADLGPFSSGSTRSLMAVEAIKYSLFNIDYVQEIKFYVDGRATGEFLHGMDLSTVYKRSATPTAWLGIRTSGERLLVGPVAVYPTLSNPVEDVLALLKSGIAQEGSSDALIAPVPGNVTILSAVQEGSVVTVDLAVEGELYGGNPALTAFMVDAMTQSLTSIQGVDGVRFMLNGTPAGSLNGLNLSEIQRRKALVNPLE